jgi:hypothetical protein
VIVVWNMKKRLIVTNLVGFLALNVVSGAVSIVCRKAFKLTKYLTYIFAGAVPKIMKISLITL